MPTGALIRDFTKTSRELRFTNSGSFEFSEIEHNAYLARVTVEIDEVDAQRYYNVKTLPSHSHYGYLTTFKGSSVLGRIPVEFTRQRVFEGINQGIWNYHQSTESLQLLSGVTVESSKKSADSVVERLGENVSDALCFVVRLLETLEGETAPPWLLEILGCDDPAAESESIVNKYRAFPIASPYPDIFKFRADIPVSFRFRLEFWYLVEPVVYIADNPTDTDDETEDEDEYPEPGEGDGDGDGSEFPEPDPIPSGRDPRDFPNGSGSSDWFPGAMARISYTRYAYGPGCVELTLPDQTVLGTTGPGSYSFEYIGSVNGCDGAQTAGGLKLVTPSGARVEIAVLQEQQWQLATVDSVVYF